MSERVGMFSKSPVPGEFDAAHYGELSSKHFDEIMEVAREEHGKLPYLVQTADERITELNNNGASDEEINKVIRRKQIYEHRLMEEPEVDTLKQAHLIATKWSSENADSYSEQVALRHRQTSPFSVFLTRNSRKSGDSEHSSAESKARPLRSDSLAEAQRDYQVSLLVTQKIEHELIDIQNISDPERAKKMATLTRLLGDGTASSTGQLFKLNQAIRDKRLLHSGHYERDADTGEVTQKNGRYHDTLLNFYEFWHDLSEKHGRIGKIVKVAAVVGAGAVVMATAGLAGVGVAGAAAVGAGTRIAKSAGTMFVDRKANELEKAKVAAKIVEDKLERDRQIAHSNIRNGSDMPSDFDTYIYNLLRQEHTNEAHNSYRANRKRALATVAGFAGGAVIGHIISNGNMGMGMPNISVPSISLGIPDSMEFWNDDESERSDTDESPSQPETTEQTPPPATETAPEEADNGDSGDNGESEGTDKADQGQETDNEIDGGVNVVNGGSYSELFADSAEAAAGVELTDAQEWQLYSYIEDNTQNGNFLTSQNESYQISEDNWGIRNPGEYEYRTRTERLMQQWLEENDDELEEAA